jgi:GNAT superfamily N-acetyltransferase
VRLTTWLERPELAELGIPSARVWPEYNLHGDVFDELWEPVLQTFPQYQFALLGDDDVVLAEGHCAPFAWDGEDASLPPGIDAALRAIVAGRPADTLCALAAEVDPDARRQGLARALLDGMRSLGERHGLRRFVAPLRPSWKERYPLTPIERYVTWRREDGQLLDPWMRLHERLGARVGPALPESMLISGTVAEWSQWTGLAFPESGAYVFPQGLSPLTVEHDRGIYYEPNVWLIHPELSPS